MTPQQRAERLCDNAKRLGLINPVTGEGAPSIAMLIDALHDAESDGQQDKAMAEVQTTIRVQNTLRELSHRVHSGYDFSSDPDHMTLRVSDALAL